VQAKLKTNFLEEVVILVCRDAYSDSWRVQINGICHPSKSFSTELLPVLFNLHSRDILVQFNLSYRPLLFANIRLLIDTILYLDFILLTRIQNRAI